VTLGDSLEVVPKVSTWPASLASRDTLLKLLHNAGISSNTTAQMLARFNRDVAAYHPDMLLVQGGSNDVDRGVPQATIISHLKSIVDAAQARGMYVFLITIPPEGSPTFAKAIVSLNAAIIGLARSERAWSIDIHKVLSTSRGVFQAKYTADGIHFSVLGARTVAATIDDGLRDLGF
jgi:lysophospholipase L1-like esterase